MPNSTHTDIVKAILLDVDNRGYLKARERNDLEFKANFGDIREYLKTCAGFANNKGGYLIFGIKNLPHELLGMTNQRFNKLDPADITQVFNKFFEPYIDFEIGVVNHQHKQFGFLYIHQSGEKPIICKSNNNESDITLGDIYYRYRGRSEKIRFNDLKRIIQVQVDSINQRWMQLFKNASNAGIENVSVLNTKNGELNVGLGSQKVLVDQSILQKLKLIKEGEFDEVKGAPTLRVVGEVHGVIGTHTIDTNSRRPINPNVDYPYIKKTLSDALGIKPTSIAAVIWKLNLDSDTSMCLLNWVGKQPFHRYSERALAKLRGFVAENKNNLDSVLKTVLREHQQRPRK
jgi:hypothetical protein